MISLMMCEGREKYAPCSHINQPVIDRLCARRCNTGDDFFFPRYSRVQDILPVQLIICVDGLANFSRDP